MSNGISQLGYMAFGVKDLPAWETFMTKVLGLGLVQKHDDGAMAFRMDDHAQRFLIVPGHDDMAFVGWECASETDARALGQRVSEAGIDVTDGTAEECALRRVQGFVRFRDHARNPIELAWGCARESTPFRSDYVGSGFQADDLGLGHFVIRSKDRTEGERFYIDVLGFKLSDYIICDIGGYAVDIAFLHANGRHHSLAIGGQLAHRLHHFMIEVNALDDVGLAYDRARDHGVIIEQELGRHPNDRMFSFYAQTPSGFQFEFGYGGRIVNDETWQPTTYNAISEWGHRRPPRKKKPVAEGETR
jgi:2,3-dihydroxybiphenyl 1,2-dioxygenase